MQLSLQLEDGATNFKSQHLVLAGAIHYSTQRSGKHIYRQATRRPIEEINRHAADFQ